MQLKKKVISLLVGISLVALGMFTSCGNPSGGTDGNEKETEVFEPKPEYEAVDNGIKLSWGEVPSNIKHIRIYTWRGSRDYNLFDINDISKKYVIDENVTAGQLYEYRIVYCDEDWNWIEYPDWFTVKAESGKGERTFKAEAKDNGIKISAQLTSEVFHASIEKFIGDEIHKLFIYKTDDDENASNGYESFTDKYVDSGTEYEYLLITQIGHYGYTDQKTHEYVPASPIVEYPRFKSITLNATAGSGRINTKKLPEASYDTNNKTITINQRPEFSVNPDYWELNFNYKKSNTGLWTFVNFNSSEKDKDGNFINTKEINKNISNGLWNFAECWFHLEFENFAYEYGEYELPKVPDVIPLGVDEKTLFMPVLKATDEGIEIEWQNLPSNTKKLEIRDGENGKTLFEINDLSAVTSVTDKYVTKDSNYEYYLVARDEKGSWLERSETVRKKATGGSNERTFTATATDSGIHLEGNTSTDAFYFEIKKVIKGKNENESYFYLNDIKKSNASFDITDIFVSKDIEYEYIINEVIGDRGGTRNNEVVPPDSIIEYPRYKNVYVKAIGGSGPAEIINEPEATLTNGKIQFSTVPQIQNIDGLKYWNFEFNYYCKSADCHWSLFGYRSNDADQNDSWTNIENAPSGNWILDQYWVELFFGSYGYTQYSNNLKKLGKLPEITL